jgi:hypothetical protein
MRSGSWCEGRGVGGVVWSLEKRGSQFARHSLVVKLCAEETSIQSSPVQSVSPQSTPASPFQPNPH